MARAPRRPVPRRSEIETLAMAICARVYGHDCACDKRQDPRPCDCMKAAANIAVVTLAPNELESFLAQDREIEKDRHP